MASSINCIFALVALAVVIQTGAAVEKCWSCSSEQNGVCEHLDNATALTRVNYLRDCRYSESPNSYINTEKRICRKFIYTENGKTITARQCDFPLSDERDIEDGPCGHQFASKSSYRTLLSCNICSTDGCNSGTSLTGSRLFGMFSIIVAIGGIKFYGF